MKIKKLTLKEIITIDTKMAKKNIPFKLRKYFLREKLDINKIFTNMENQIYMKNIKRVNKWYSFKYNINLHLDDEFIIPVALNNKIYFINYYRKGFSKYKLTISNIENVVLLGKVIMINLTPLLKKSLMPVIKLGEDEKEKIIKMMDYTNYGFNLLYNHENLKSNLKNKVLLYKSYEDYLSAIANLRYNNISNALWDIQQAIEKLLKWFLNFFTDKVSYSHDIVKIIKEIKKYKVSFYNNETLLKSLSEDYLLELNAKMRYNYTLKNIKYNYEDACKCVYFYFEIFAEINRVSK